MTTEDAARLAEIQDRLAKATPGPWALDEGDGETITVCAGTAISNRGRYSTTDMIYERDVDYLYEDEDIPGPDVEQIVADANLIANAPADLGFLMDRLGEANDVNEELLAELAKAQRERDGARDVIRVEQDIDARNRKAFAIEAFTAPDADWFTILASLRARIGDTHSEIRSRDAEVSVLRTALEGLPEQIAQEIEAMKAPGGMGPNIQGGYRVAVVDAARRARSFAASRPTPAPEASE